MSRLHWDIVIDCPPDEVFAYLTDFARHPEWRTSYVETRQISSGPVGVGTRVVKARPTPLGRLVYTAEVTHYDPGLGAFDERVLDSAIAGSGSSWRVAPAGSGSRLTVDMEMRARGWWSLFQPFVTLSTRNEMEAALGRLKTILERGSRVPS